MYKWQLCRILKGVINQPIELSPNCHLNIHARMLNMSYYLIYKVIIVDIYKKIDTYCKYYLDYSSFNIMTYVLLQVVNIILIITEGT